MCVFFWGGIILAGNRARPAVPGSQASKKWNELPKMSELFTVGANSLALTSMDSSLSPVVLITEEPLSSCPKKDAWPKEMTLALIRLYKSHEHLFNKVNIKKKSVWELICNRIKQMGVLKNYSGQTVRKSGNH